MRILRFEGPDYEIREEEVAPGVIEAVRPGIKPKREDFESDETFVTALKEWRATAANATVGFAKAELKDSGEGWWYLPRRIGPPLGGDYLERGDKTIWLIEPHPLRDIIRAHPLWIAGRDDLAAAKVAELLGVTPTKSL